MQVAHNTTAIQDKMATLTLTFNLSAIPLEYQSHFMAQLHSLSVEYQNLTSVPPASALPPPESFAPVKEAEVLEEVVVEEPAPVKPSASPPPVEKKARKSQWDTMSPEQKAERIAKMKAGRQAAKAFRESHWDNAEAKCTGEQGSLDLRRLQLWAPVEGAIAPEETVWTKMTPEQKAERIAKMWVGSAATEQKKKDVFPAVKEAVNGTAPLLSAMKE